MIKKFKKRKVNARFKDNIWASDLAELGSLSSKTSDFKYLLYVVDVFTRYACVKLLKDNKAKTFLQVFIEKVNKSKYIP